MANLSVQTLGLGGLNQSYGAVADGDTFPNDGNTFLQFENGNASSRTLTIPANDTEKPGFGTIVTPDTVYAIPGSGTNGGKCMIGPFPPDRFNDPATGRATINLSASTGLTVAVVKMPRNA
jgi:hypothetical protein